MGGHDQKRDEHHRGEEPIDHEGDEGQAEHVEADVVAELGVGDSERLLVAEHQPVLPVAHCGCGEQQSGDDGYADAQRPQPVAEELVEPLDQRMGVGGECGRSQPIGDHQVEYGERHEGSTEQEEHQQLGTKHGGEDTGPADRVEPQVVGVEAGEEPTEQQHADDDDRHGDECYAPLVGESPTR